MRTGTSARNRLVIGAALLVGGMSAGALLSASLFAPAVEKAHRVGACLALETGAMYGAIDDKTRSMIMRSLASPAWTAAPSVMGSYRALDATCIDLSKRSQDH